MLPVEFEPMIPVGERPQTYALDRAATGTANFLFHYESKILSVLYVSQLVSTLAKNKFGTSHPFSRVLSARCPSHDVTVTMVTTVSRDVQLSALHIRPCNQRVA